ncbi:MAG: hypothetical protein LBU91_08065 [Bacteroidales bacterium]|jgi:hypothetical protein|nr:hypothetical protein [Bacteroidales bacterium]
MKTKLFTLAFLSTIIMLFTTSCGEDCSAFPEDLANYFPYEKDERLYFLTKKIR